VKKPPNTYRLTFLPDYDGAAPTDEWRRWEPSKGAEKAGWAAAAERARKAAQNARKRRLRAEDEADSAVKASEALLKRLGKTKIGRPGNRQTRAALNQVNGRQALISHPPWTGVEPPPSDQGTPFPPPWDGGGRPPPWDGGTFYILGILWRERGKGA